MNNKQDDMTMKSAGKRTFVPQLRFPEFQEEGGWQTTQLENLISTVTPPKKIPTSDYLSEGLFPIIDQGQSDVAGWTNDPEAIIEGNQPLIVFGDHTCALKLIRESFAQGADGIKILRAGGLVDTSFLYQFLCFRPVITEEYKRHFSILKTKVVVYPDRNSGEQQKIANCLDSIDEVIALEEKKFDTLKTHKKGLMQQFFPSDDETLPKLRFPEFRNAAEWEQTSIGQLGEVVTGNTPSTTMPEYYGGEKLFVSPADISYGRFIDKTKTTLSAQGFKETRPIKANSILFVCIGSTIGKVAQNRRECATNQQINSVVPNSNNSDGFVYYALSGMADKIASLAGKHAVPIVNKSLFSSFKLLVPKLPEQIRIAECLSSLDELIVAQSQNIGAIKDYKIGLMQNLFPALDEVQE